MENKERATRAVHGTNEATNHDAVHLENAPRRAADATRIVEDVDVGKRGEDVDLTSDGSAVL